MRDEILDMCIEVLRRTRYPDASRASVRHDPEHAAAVVGLLKDCRPLPLIRALIDELEGGMAARGR
jgi:hypothetical protein